MKQPDEFSRTLELARQTPQYWTELSILEFTEGIRRLMGSMSQAELARRIASSEAYVSAFLNGEDDFTLHQMNKISGALNAAVHVCVVERDKRVTWKEEPLAAPSRVSNSGVTVVRFGEPMSHSLAAEG